MTSAQYITFGLIYIPTLIGLGWLFYRSWEEFMDSVQYVLMPDFISLLTGKFIADVLGEMRFFLFVTAALLVAGGERWVIEEIWKLAN